MNKRKLLAIIGLTLGAYLVGAAVSGYQLRREIAAMEAERKELVQRYEVLLNAKIEADQNEHNTFDGDIGPNSVVKGKGAELSLLRGAQEQVEILSKDVNDLVLERDRLRKQLGIER
jgi:hypothetical protein